MAFIPKKYFNHLQKYLLPVFLAIFLTLTLCFIYNETRAPVYEATAVMKLESLPPDLLPLKHPLHTETLLTMHAEQLVSKKALTRLARHPEISPLLANESLDQSLSARVQANTQFLLITAKNTNPQLAYLLAKHLPSAQQKIFSLVSQPEFPLLPEYPKKLRNLVLALGAGIVLGLFLALILNSSRLPKSLSLSS